MSEQDLVEVYRAGNGPVAYLLKGALEEAGIPVAIVGEMLQGAIGEVPAGWSTSLRVLVEHQDAERAREIVRQKEEAALARADANEGGDAVVCLSCGTPLREEEETCPVCGWSYKNGYATEAR